MASLSFNKAGSGKIQFSILADGKRERRTIWLGEISVKNARKINGHVEELLTAKIQGCNIAEDTAHWLVKIGDDLHSKIAKVDLVESRSTASAKLKPFCDGFIAEKTDVKETTRKNYRLASTHLCNYFGPERLLKSISVAETNDFRRYLRKAKPSGAGIGENTARKSCSICRQFFKDALERRLIRENPFGKMKSLVVKKDVDKFFYITDEMAASVIKQCPSNTWKFIFTAARYCGMRPHEILLLRFGDFDWDNNRFTIHSKKTEHLADKGIRICPMFKEFRPYAKAMLEEVLADENFDPKLDRLSERKVVQGYLSGATALNRPLMRIIVKAGFVPWADLFINLRSSAATQLRENYPEIFVNSALGHTEEISRMHYQQITENHWKMVEATPNRLETLLKPSGENSGTNAANTAENAGNQSVASFNSPNEE